MAKNLEQTVIPFTQLDGAPVRVVGNVYQNTREKPRLVVVSLAHSGAHSSHQMQVENANPPTIPCAVVELNVASTTTPMTVVVPPGFYYKLVASLGVAAVAAWVEFDG